jgi:hypothetical protein
MLYDTVFREISALGMMIQESLTEYEIHEDQHSI